MSKCTIQIESPEAATLAVSLMKALQDTGQKVGAITLIPTGGTGTRASAAPQQVRFGSVTGMQAGALPRKANKRRRRGSQKRPTA